MPRFLKNRRRAELRKRPFPAKWLGILRQRVPYYSLLTGVEQQTLQQHIQIFLDEKNFEGCKGFEITDDARLVVSAYACLLLLNIDVDYYPRLKSLLIYPNAFVAPHHSRDAAGVVSEVDEINTGESWNIGAVILAWDEVERDMQSFDGHNVVLHEFAHQLDQGDGDADGWPAHLDPHLDHRWAEVMGREYEALVRKTDRRQRTLIDEYGATSPAEFFAVITELFFERPREMQKAHAELYEMFQSFYRQDPAARFA